ncbi:MAG: hypothetical protein HY700_05240 [Gemmatimonadetes bacterium]|nr:hypothetical protein [Gemmatimonadota bacterium]
MKLNAKALAITVAVLWGGSVFLVALLNRFWPPYGGAFLDLASSIYPGVHPGGMRAGIVGTAYAVVDGAVCGFLVAWVYNQVSGRVAATREPVRERTAAGV